MKLQRQGNMECLLASLAMLAEVPLEQLRQEVLDDVGVEWTLLVSARKYLHIFWSEYERLCTRHCPALPAMEGYLCVGDPPLGLRPPPLGRGVMIVQHRNSSRGHAVAFEDGWVYDPAASACEPIPIDQYLGEDLAVLSVQVEQQVEEGQGT